MTAKPLLGTAALVTGASIGRVAFNEILVRAAEQTW